MGDKKFIKETKMAEEFEHLNCPICGSELVYSEGTHDLGCRKNPKPLDHNKRNNRFFHEQPVSYNSSSSSGNSAEPVDKPTAEGEHRGHICDIGNSSSGNESGRVCELVMKNSSRCEIQNNKTADRCMFGISFTETLFRERSGVSE